MLAIHPYLVKGGSHPVPHATISPIPSDLLAYPSTTAHAVEGSWTSHVPTTRLHNHQLLQPAHLLAVYTYKSCSCSASSFAAFIQSYTQEPAIVNERCIIFHHITSVNAKLISQVRRE